MRLTLAAALVLTLAACGGPDSGETNDALADADTPVVAPIDTTLVATGPDVEVPTEHEGAVSGSVDEIAGVPFGVSRDSVARIMRRRFEVQPVEGEGSGLAYQGGTYAGVPVSRWRFAFDGNRFTELQLVLDVSTQQGGTPFIAISDLLTQRYGARPRRVSDGHEQWALGTGTIDLRRAPDRPEAITLHVRATR